MTAKSRRKRGSNVPRPELARAGQGTAHAQPARTTTLPGEWHWRTFPVLFAFSIGAFMGLYLGILTTATDNFWFTLVIFSGFAMLLGWGLSRFVVRSLARRRLLRARAGQS